MHLQIRVTPFGEIVAISQRGMFTGNRGIIHDPATKTLLNRRWATKTWQQDRPLPSTPDKPIDGQTRAMPDRSGFTTLMDC